MVLFHRYAIQQEAKEKPHMSEIGDAQLGHSTLFTFESFGLNLVTHNLQTVKYVWAICSARKRTLTANKTTHILHEHYMLLIGADSTGATTNFAPVLTQEPGQTLRFAPVPFMAVLWFFKWTLQLYLLNLTKGAKLAGSVGHPMTKMLSASGGLRPWPPDQGLCSWTPLGALPLDPHYTLVLRTRHGAPSTTDSFRRLWVQLNFAPVPQTESRRLWLQCILWT